MSERASFHRRSFVHVSAARGVTPHAAPVHKLVIGVDADLEVERDGKVGRAGAILVGPDVAQSMHAPGISVAFFVDPGSRFAPYRGVGEGLVVPRGRSLDRLRAIGREAVREGDDGDADRLAEAFAAAGLVADERIDPRVERALRILTFDPNAAIGSVARAVGLSPERLRHLVASECGLSLRRHRLWHRTIDATVRVVSGASLSPAAFDAGFSDLPHYSRSFAGFFGRAPSTVSMPTRIVAPYVDRSGGDAEPVPR